MKITVDRYQSDPDSTVSRVSVDGVFVCYGLEDGYRAQKVAGETRIPAGAYVIGVRKVGGFHGRYARDVRFKDIHRGMLHILDIPNFEWVLIHVGNTHEHTAGCLLVGTAVNATPGRMSIGASAVAYRKLYSMVIDAAEAGDLWIEYIDNDRAGG
ncbi:DUF5675 family protein [Thalassospira povalilytica]|uniref:DUF5675 family protein n=1 Tax=Thalassospira povalilytica TaxID=732237 RepID=UPI003AA8C773